MGAQGLTVFVVRLLDANGRGIEGPSRVIRRHLVHKVHPGCRQEEPYKHAEEHVVDAVAIMCRSMWAADGVKQGLGHYGKQPASQAGKKESPALASLLHCSERTRTSPLIQRLLAAPPTALIY